MNPAEASEPDEVTLDELAALRAGELSPEEEARLQVRIASDPHGAEKLWALDNVHRLFDLDERSSSPSTSSPGAPELPAARLQARIAEEALRRAEEGSARRCNEDDDGPPER